MRRTSLHRLAHNPIASARIGARHKNEIVCVHTKCPPVSRCVVALLLSYCMCRLTGVGTRCVQRAEKKTFTQKEMLSRKEHQLAALQHKHKLELSNEVGKVEKEEEEEVEEVEEEGDGRM